MTQEELKKLIEKRDTLDKRIKEEKRKIEYNKQLQEIKPLLSKESQLDLLGSIFFVAYDGTIIQEIKPSTILYSKIINCIKNCKEKN